METTELQQQLFSFLKDNLPPHLSLVDELGDLLGVGSDSVYRRIRGEKPVTLMELKKICEHFHLSLDQLLQLKNDSVVFRAPDLGKEHFPFADVLKSILQQLKHFNSFKTKQLLYLCKDMPIWQFFLYPELAAFKTFVWAKSIHNEPLYAGKLFSLEEMMVEDYFKTGQKIIHEYNQIPSIELWNEESINSTLNQIKFYKDSGGFKQAKDVDVILDSFELTIKHLSMQAEKGVKFMPGEADILKKAPVQLYVNEIVIGSNTILVELDNTKLSIIPYNVFSYILTKDARFNESMFNGFNTLKNRSTLISVTGEKERNRFFTFQLEKVKSLHK